MSDRPSFARTRTGKDVRVAHRRTPSEMTPLVRDNLAMQHHMYQGQPQFMVPAYPQYMPYQMPPPGMVIPQMMPCQYQQQPQHQRTRSHGGHQRRHSLVVSEAREAARQRQEQEQQEQEDKAEDKHDAMPSFKFPPSPDKMAGSQGQPKSGHQRSNSNRFQLPAQPFMPSRHAHSNSTSHTHRRSDSRNYDNWRSGQSTQTEDGHLSTFVPSHRHGTASFSSVSSIAAFAESQSPGPSRKSLFAPYLSQASIPQLLADGYLVQGTLRVNRKNRSDAYVSTDVLDADIFICGSKDRNRALEGDVVAIELLDVDEVWDAKREKEEKKRRRDTSDDTKLVETASGELRRKGSLRSRPTQKRNDDVEVEGQTMLLNEEEPLSDECRPLYAGHVVAVLERPAGQLFSGTLGLLRPSSQATKERQDAERAEKGQPPLHEQKHDRPKIVWFKPTDKCVPLMAIPTEQAPADFVENHQSYAEKIFVAAVKRWPITSLHPFGTIVEELGASNDPDVEIKAILRDNNFGAHRFSDAALADVNALDLSVENRKKVEGVAIEFSTGLVEQAFDVRKVDKGGYELTITTVDLSVIREESPLDRELRHKSAGTYLCQRSSPLAPPQVLAKLGLDSSTEKPALSLRFELDDKFQVTEASLFASAIKPKVVNYEKFTSEPSFELLRKIANAWQETRIGTNKLSIDQLLTVKVPAKPDLFASDEVSRVVDALNHTVNATVAQKLLSGYGNATLLYRQGEPQISRIENLSNALRSANYKFDSSSAHSIARSIAAIEDKDVLLAAEIGLLKALVSPRYVASGRTDPMSFGHYWFSEPAYTTFTAPLRRYADKLVHCQVQSMLKKQQSTPEDEQRVALLSSELIFRLECAKNAQEQSIHLLISQKIASLAAPTGYILRTGIVTQVYESAFDVVIPEFCIEKRVHGDQLPLVKAEFSKDSHRLELYWDPKEDAATFTPAGNSNKIRSSSTKQIAEKSSDKPLSKMIELLDTRKDGDSYIQTIELLRKVPVLLRTDVGGRVIPSIVVRAINPFFNA